LITEKSKDRITEKSKDRITEKSKDRINESGIRGSGPVMSRPQARPPQPEEHQLVWKGFEKFFDRITPWLFDLGLWVFGSLLAFNLLLLAALFAIGTVDRAATLATAAFAFALPLNVAGLLLLRVVRELTDIKLEDELARAFEEVGFTGAGQVATPPVLEALRRRRSKMVLRTFPAILAVSALLTLTGTFAMLWHMAWWIALGFLAMVIASLVIVSLAVAGLEPRKMRGEKEEQGHARK
jgi:hypothetical protein